jgi:hypothetical protein
MGKRPGALTIHACTKSMAATSFRTVTVAVMSRCRYHAARRSGQRFAYIATTLQHTKNRNCELSVCLALMETLALAD